MSKNRNSNSHLPGLLWGLGMMSEALRSRSSINTSGDGAPGAPASLRAQSLSRSGLPPSAGAPLLWEMGRAAVNGVAPTPVPVAGLWRSRAPCRGQLCGGGRGLQWAGGMLLPASVKPEVNSEDRRSSRLRFRRITQCNRLPTAHLSEPISGCLICVLFHFESSMG